MKNLQAKKSVVKQCPCDDFSPKRFSMSNSFVQYKDLLKNRSKKAPSRVKLFPDLFDMTIAYFYQPIMLKFLRFLNESSTWNYL